MYLPTTVTQVTVHNEVDFNLGAKCLHWFPCAFFNRFKLEISGLLLQRVHLAKIFNLLPRTFGIRHKKKIMPSENWKIWQWLHINKEILRPIVHGVHGGWKVMKALVQLEYSHFKLCVLYDDGRQPPLRPSLDGKRQPFSIRLPYVRQLATGPKGTVTVPVWRTRLSV